MYASPITQKIEEMVAPAMEAMGYRLVLARLIEGSGKKAPRTLQIMAERIDEAEMSVENCAQISRTVSALLDVEDPIEGAYNLEISSPGMDRPLVKLEDFARFTGEAAKVETAMPVEGRRRFKGKIAGVEGENVVLDMEEGRIALRFGNIHSAKLVLTEAIIKRSLAEGEQRKKKQSNH